MTPEEVTVKCLRDKQQAAVISMLHFNDANTQQSSAEQGDDEPVWKVLIYDRFGRDVISPLLRVGELRENAVTLHMLLHSDRQPIPDVPAIYFIEPTQDNIRRVCKDLTSRLYDSYAINFLSAVPRPLLEELAAAAIASDTAGNIIKIYDQYLNYISLEPYLFVLNQQDAYLTLNNSGASDTEIESTVDKIVLGLFSVLATLGDVPIIRSPRGNAAEMVAQKLDQRLRDHLANTRHNLFMETVGTVAYQRPVLILLDRNVDLTTPLQHTWTYEPLIHDVLDLKLNRVILEVTDASVTKKKEYDLDAKDSFWIKNVSVPFPQVAENVDVELAKYKESSEKISRLSNSTPEELLSQSAAGAPMPSVGVDTEALRLAISSLPQLNETKRLLDMHMNIATALLKAIKDRHLDVFYSTEENITRQTKTSVLDIIKDATKGTPEDKLRLGIIFYLSVEDLPANDFTELDQALKAAGASTGALHYLKQLRAFGRMTAMANQPSTKTSTDSLFGFKSLGSRLTEGLMEGVMDNAVQMLKSGVNSLKTILPSDKTLAVTKLVDALMENKSGGDADNYIFLDPKSSKKTDGRTPPRNRPPFQSAIVFIVGGGNYIEYLNLQEYSRNAISPKNITYGSTDIASPRAFLKQLQELGTEQPSPTR